MTQIRDTLADEGNKRLTTKRHRGIRYAITVATAIFANRSIRRCRPYEENERWSALLSPSAEATRDRRICITLEGGWSYRRYVQSEYHVPTKQIFLLLPLPEQEVCMRSGFILAGCILILESLDHNLQLLWSLLLFFISASITNVIGCFYYWKFLFYFPIQRFFS